MQHTTGTSRATERIKSVTGHLRPAPAPASASATSTTTTASSINMSAPIEKPKITCHVLDTTVGRPGVNIPVTLTCTAAWTLLQGAKHQESTIEGQAFTGLTNSDGRIVQWEHRDGSNGPTLNQLLGSAKEGLVTTWALKFDTSAYWEAKGIQPFFPEVVVQFAVRNAHVEHYHVPVLMGPFNYTTYRGS